MRIISRKALVIFCQREPNATDEVLAWFAETRHAEWNSPSELKAKYGKASILKDGRVVFNICGNKYRMVVWINYEFLTIYIRFLGTHDEYDQIDAQTI